MPYFFQNTIDVTPAGTTGWQNVDLSSYISQDATVVILRVLNLSASNQLIGARHPLQVDANIATSYLAGTAIGTQITLFAGLDGSRYVSLYKNVATTHYYLEGYFQGSEATWPLTTLAISPIVGSWQVASLVSVIPSSAVANFAIILSQNAAIATGYNVRARHSTDDRQPLNSCQSSTMVVPLDSNREFEIYYETGTPTVKFVGYINIGTGKSSGLPISSGLGTGSYVNATIDDANIPVGMLTTNLAAILEVRSGGGIGKQFDYRGINSTDTFYYDNYDFNGFHIVPVDPVSKAIQIKRVSTGVDYYVWGYLHPPSITGSGAITWPTLETLGAGIIAIFGSGAITWPSLDFSAYLPIIGSGAIAWPSFNIEGTGIQGHYGKLSANLPIPIIYLDAGGVLKATLPMIQISFTELPYHAGKLIADLPFIKLIMEGLQGNIGTLSANLFVPTINLSGHTSNSGVLISDLPFPELLLRELISQYGCIILNLSNKAVSKYTNFKFNSLARHKSLILAASESGLFVLGGNTDNGANIDAHIKTVRDDFGNNQLKNIPEAIIGIKGGDMEVQTFQDDSLSGIQILPSSGSNMRNRRVKLSRAGLYRYWGVKLSNFAGSDFKIDSITLPVYLSKRSINE